MALTEKEISKKLETVRNVFFKIYKKHEKTSIIKEKKYIKAKKLFKKIKNTLCLQNKKSRHFPAMTLFFINAEIGILQCQINLVSCIEIKNEKDLKKIDGALNLCNKEIETSMNNLTKLPKKLFYKNKLYQNFYSEIEKCYQEKDVSIAQVRATYYYNYAMDLVENDQKTIPDIQYIETLFQKSAKLYGEANKKKEQQETLTIMEETIKKIKQKHAEKAPIDIPPSAKTQETIQPSSRNPPKSRKRFWSGDSLPSTSQSSPLHRQSSLPEKIIQPLSTTKKQKLSLEESVTSFNKKYSLSTTCIKNRKNKVFFNEEQEDIILAKIKIKNGEDKEDIKILKKISQENSNKPVLIKYVQDKIKEKRREKYGIIFKIFGYSSSGKLEITTLGTPNDLPEFEQLHFPKISKTQLEVELPTKGLHNVLLTYALYEKIKIGHVFSEEANNRILQAINNANIITSLTKTIASSSDILLPTDGQETSDNKLQQEWHEALVTILKNLPPSNHYALYSQLFYHLANAFISLNELATGGPTLHRQHIQLTVLSWLQIALTLAQLDPANSLHCALLKKKSFDLYQSQKIKYQHLIQQIKTVKHDEEHPYVTYTCQTLQEKLTGGAATPITNDDIKNFFLLEMESHLFTQEVLMQSARYEKYAYLLNPYTLQRLCEIMNGALLFIERYHTIDQVIDAGIEKILLSLDNVPENISCFLYTKLFCALTNLYLVKDHQAWQWLAENNLLFHTSQIVSLEESIEKWLKTAKQLINQQTTSPSHQVDTIETKKMRQEIVELRKLALSKNLNINTSSNFFQPPADQQIDPKKSFKIALEKNLKRLNAIDNTVAAPALTVDNINTLLNRFSEMVKTVYKNTLPHDNVDKQPTIMSLL